MTRSHLAHVDLFLTFWGQIHHSHLVEGMGLSRATAMRAFQSFMTEYPEQVQRRAGYLVANDDHIPNFEHDLELGMSLFAYGQTTHKTSLHSFGPEPTPSFFKEALSLSHCTSVTKAISMRRTLNIVYHSVASGPLERTFSPHAIFKSLGYWYARGYDSRRDRFLTLKLSRIGSPTIGSEALPSHQQHFDTDWTENVSLVVQVHPRHPRKDSIASDLGITGNEVVTISVRRALVGFVLNEMRVDCSSDGVLDPNSFPLQLRNHTELKGSDSIVFAPGFGTASNAE